MFSLKGTLVGDGSPKESDSVRHIPAVQASASSECHLYALS